MYNLFLSGYIFILVYFLNITFLIKYYTFVQELFQFFESKYAFVKVDLLYGGLILVGKTRVWY